MLTLRMLHAAMFAQSPDGFWGLNLLLWGDPGTGKTSFVRQFAKSVNLPYERLSPAERGEGAFGVVPVPGADGLLHYPPPDWTARFVDGGLLFLDEMNTAGPALAAPLLGLSQLRVIGDKTLHRRTRVLAAANETADAAGGWDLARSLENRFGHLQFDGLDVDEYTQGLVLGFGRDDAPSIDAHKEEERVLSLWPAADGNGRALIAGFVRSVREAIHKKPAPGDASRAWPSRRSLEYAATVIAASQVHSLTRVEQDALMAAFVGTGVTVQFGAWEAAADLPDPIAVLDGSVKFKHDPRRLDRTYTVLGSCAAAVKGTDDKTVRKGRADRLWTIIGEVSKDSVSAVVPAGMVLAKLGYVTGAASKPLGALAPLLSAGGIVVPQGSL